MNAHERAQESNSQAGGLAHAIYFPSGARLLFGWLHQPTGTETSRLGLVICKPFGYEATCAHRSVRSFAEAAAKLGIATLRFDYLGCGDSADSDFDVDQIAVWTDNVLAAVAELKRVTGVEKVCLLGIRLGGLLAVLASRRSEAIDSLVLIAPVLNGNRFLRELRTTRLAATLSSGPDQINAGPVIQHAPLGASEMEISGFPLSAASQLALAGVDFKPTDAAGLPKTLIIDGTALPTSRTWVEQLDRTSDRTQYLVLPGLIEMIMRSPLRAVVPLAMVSAATGFLAERSQKLGVRTHAADGRYLSVDPISPVLPLEDLGTCQAIVERTVFIPADTLLFGIVTEPKVDDRRRCGVILLNTGADNHIGANRMHVRVARRWARYGCVVLRIDLGGLGDSDTRTGCQKDEVFPEAAVDEIRSAIDFIRARYGVDYVTVGGVCSGAYHALRAAASKLAINQIFLVNPQNYFWKKGMQIDELQLAEVVQKPTLWFGQLFSRHAWQRLMRGEVRLGRVVKVYVGRALLALESTAREVARYCKVPLPNDLGTELKEICGRGVRVIFVFARNEPGVRLLELQGGSAVAGLGERCQVHVVDGGDHIFSQRQYRSVMEDLLTQELFTRLQPAVVGNLQTSPQG